MSTRENIRLIARTPFVTSFLVFNKKKGMILHEKRLPADDSHEISYLICYFEKKNSKI